ncbi:hypothetical protein [uncultured Desulfovibrio sp.]|mgnify:CR=1 FL=1|uniref:hypothetical protein n=1 Tax=uncultured Desulfovibrio sp. TaxID=167968 RepID=UPI002062C372|nr:hypothetical protein [uncultured Desulfovibrio sp.]DAV75448.1 MAG TPA: minor tail protein Z [Caudoviricetes sp.]
MLRLDLSADVSGASLFLNQLRAGKAARAIAEALNKTAMSARDAVRKDMPRRFTIRRPWVLQGIGVRFARSGTLEAAVFSRDEFMREQEFGGIRHGSKARSIPMGRIRDLHRKTVIPKAMRPQALMARRTTFYRNGMLYERRDKNHIELLYQFRKQAKIPQRFGMRETVRSQALRTMRTDLERAIYNALGEGV